MRSNIVNVRSKTLFRFYNPRGFSGKPNGVKINNNNNKDDDSYDLKMRKKKTMAKKRRKIVDLGRERLRLPGALQHLDLSETGRARMWETLWIGVDGVVEEEARELKVDANEDLIIGA
ncbi:hypothetical protein LOK49_Contig162G00002 [Camellia lanceoleosa]|nr:hypothetical protein LOK49_Contig162G00002 [Camellia lanceoleosa]